MRFLEAKAISAAPLFGETGKYFIFIRQLEPARLAAFAVARVVHPSTS